jgi:hypothetical protein
MGRLGERREEIEADLEELFKRRSEDHGRAHAAWRYCLDALSVWKLRPARAAAPVAKPRRLNAMAQDIIFGLRLFRRQPVVFGMTVAGLALAIGISTTVFSVMNAVAFRGYGIADEGSLYRVSMRSGLGEPTAGTGNSPMEGNWSYGHFTRLRDAAKSLSVVAAARDAGPFRDAADRENGESVWVEAVNGT